MRIRNAVTSLVFAVLTLCWAGAANASELTFTLDTDAGFTQSAQVAALWSKGTGLHMVVGDCTAGPRCIQAHLTSSTACDGLSGINPPAGCTPETGADPCTVQVRQTYVEEYGQTFEFNVLGHEVGHCVLQSGWHATGKRDIMFTPSRAGDRRRAITRETKAQLALKYPAG